MKDRLISAASRMGIRMTDAQADKLCAYHDMLIKANRDMNLTRVSEDALEAADRNYLDSLTLLPLPEGTRTLIDVGTGAGLPGIPLSILCPEVKITLLDAQQKRVAFLQGVIDALRLNAEAVHGRAEEVARKPEFRDAFDVAAARAVAQLNVLCEWLLPFVKPGGRMLAMKGPAALEEAQCALPAFEALNGKLADIRSARIPDRDWDHTIVEIVKIAPTPEKFPRRAGMAEKRPIR